MEEEDDDDPIIKANHFFTADGMPIFLTEDEEYAEVPDIQTDEDYILANNVVLKAKSDDF